MLLNLKSTGGQFLLLTIMYTCVLIFMVVNTEQKYKPDVTLYTTNPENQLRLVKKPATTSRSNSLNKERNLNSKKTLVLLWSDYYQIKSEKVLEIDILSARQWDKDCCTGNVEVTTDKNLLQNATSVVFFAYFGNLKKKDMPKERTQGQIWVLFVKESPTYTPSLSSYKNIFNWTMSYRKDSDIWAPYGETVNLTASLSPHRTIRMSGGIPLNKWIQKKTKLMAWVNSNCKTSSKREVFKTDLQNEGPNIIDVFGACRGSKHICPRINKSCNHSKFWDELAQNYTFYFSAENSLCVDYITEKFWRALDIGIIPVVYGGADYEAVAPPNSYIDVRDFKSPKELVKYLKKVASDKDLHGKYFEWKRTYKVQPTNCWKGWCELCKRSRQQDISPTEVKAHSDLNNWWNKWPVGDISGSTSNKNSACLKGPLILTVKK